MYLICFPTKVIFFPKKLSKSFPLVSHIPHLIYHFMLHNQHSRNVQQSSCNKFKCPKAAAAIVVNLVVVAGIVFSYLLSLLMLHCCCCKLNAQITCEFAHVSTASTHCTPSCFFHSLQHAKQCKIMHSSCCCCCCCSVCRSKRQKQTRK